MNYEKKYKSALEWMRSIYPTMRGADKEDAEHYFPELRESEDERIRKELIQYLKDYPNLPNGNYCRNDFFAWLEKQGETEDEDDTDFTIYHPLKNSSGKYECIPYSFYGSLTSFSEDEDLINFLRNCFYTEKECKAWLEKQGEQKPVEQDTEIHDLWVYIREWNEKFGRLPKDEDELEACIDYVTKRQKPSEKVEQSYYHNDGLYYAIDILEKTFGKVEGYQSDDGIIEHQTAIETVNALYHKKPNHWKPSEEQMKGM